MVLDSDAAEFGGHARLNPHQRHVTRKAAFESGGTRDFISLYLPNRSAQVLAPVEII